MEEQKVRIAKQDNVVLQFSEITQEEARSFIHATEVNLREDLSDIARELIRGIMPNNWKALSQKIDTVCSHLAGAVNIEETCFVIWDMFSVDIVNLSHFIQNYEYYWYESRDDIFVAFPVRKIMIFIRHDGFIFGHRLI